MICKHKISNNTWLNDYMLFNESESGQKHIYAREHQLYCYNKRKEKRTCRRAREGTKCEIRSQNSFLLSMIAHLIAHPDSPPCNICMGVIQLGLEHADQR